MAHFGEKFLSWFIVFVAIAALLLFLIGLTSLTANAEEIGYLINEGGGRIVISNDQCVKGGKFFNGLHRAYAYTSEGFTMEGCWYLEDKTIVVGWPDTNSTRRYGLEGFVLTKKQEELKPNL